MDLQELLKKYLEEDKVKSFLGDMKTNKIYIANEENLDVRYSKLKDDYNLLNNTSVEDKKLIEELKSATQNNEEMQTKFTEYESKLAHLEVENEQLKIDNAIKVELLGSKAKASDLDYLMFKIKQENNELKIDENGKIKGLEVDKIKTAYPSNFEVDSKKEVDVNNLPNINDSDVKITKEQFDKMGYLEKNKLFTEDRETYDALNK